MFRQVHQMVELAVSVKCCNALFENFVQLILRYTTVNIIRL